MKMERAQIVSASRRLDGVGWALCKWGFAFALGWGICAKYYDLNGVWADARNWQTAISADGSIPGMAREIANLKFQLCIAGDVTKCKVN